MNEKSIPLAARLGLFAIALIILTVALYVTITSKASFGVDFYVYWLNARLLFLEGQSPFTAEAALQAQLDLYGRPALPHEDLKGFVYPPYSLFLILPTVWLSYAQALALWLALNLLLLVVALRYTLPKLPLWIAISTIFFYPVARGLVMGQLSVLLGILLILALAGFQSKAKQTGSSQWLTGFMLAMATIKPQLTWLVILCLLLLALKQQRRTIILSFGLSLVGLSLISWVFIPFWPGQLLQQIVYGSDEFQAARTLPEIYAGWLLPPAQAKVSGYVGLALALLTTFSILAGWWYNKISDVATLAWCTLLTQWVHPLTVPSEQIIFLLPLLIWLAHNGQTDRQPWRSMLLWLSALLGPYFIYAGLYQPGIEPLALTTLPPLLFLLWAIALTARNRASILC